MLRDVVKNGLQPRRLDAAAFDQMAAVPVRAHGGGDEVGEMLRGEKAHIFGYMIDDPLMSLQQAGD